MIRLKVGCATYPLVEADLGFGGSHAFNIIPIISIRGSLYLPHNSNPAQSQGELSEESEGDGECQKTQILPPEPENMVPLDEISQQRRS